MPLFCKNCNNVLQKISSATEFYFKCVYCAIKYEPTAEDTLQYEESKSGNLITSQIILNHAADDPVNPKIEKKCSKCGYDYAKQVRIGKDMLLINTCIKCKNQELEA